MTNKKILHFFCLLLITYIIVPQKVDAYIDPGTSSYFFQILIAGLVGFIFSIKIFYRKIKDLLASTFKKGGKNTEKNKKKDASKLL